MKKTKLFSYFDVGDKRWVTRYNDWLTDENMSLMTYFKSLGFRVRQVRAGVCR